ncbi:MAG: glycosyltransferase [Desulfuromonadaceae bacterium]|nr:glycosyltransferase [Desulfuromonadaceae bacterium]
MSPINVLYIIDSLTHGGTEKQVAELIRHLDRTRVQPHLCTLKPSSGLYDELDIPKICLDFSSFGSIAVVGVLRNLSRFISDNRIDIVQTFFQDPFLLAAMIKPFHRIKLIGSFRDLGFWRTKAESRKMHFACRFFDGYIANSQAVKDHFVAQDNLTPDRVAVIYNGFDISAIPARHSLDTTTSSIVGIVANLNRPVKRVQDFVTAAATVHKKRPDTSFVIVGGGHLQPELEALAAALGIGHCTTFTGMVANPLDYIASFSVGVITSETEGFCNAIIEYMACGVPVVASRVGGNPELIVEGVNGYLYGSGDCNELASVILRLLADSADRERIAVTNAPTVSRRYSISAMVSTTCCYYESIMTRKA